MPESRISYVEMRQLVLSAVNCTNQINGLTRIVGGLAIKKGLSHGEPARVPRPFKVGEISFDLCEPDGRDRGLIEDIMWDLVIEGVVRPGLGDGNNSGWPHYHLTEFGNHILDGQPPSVYDPDGYLKQLRADIPDVDQVIMIYLTESLHTLRINCPLSSAVTLGCAAERGVLLLIDAIAGSLDESQCKKFREGADNKLMKRKFDAVQHTIDNHFLKKFPPDLAEGLNIILISVFEMIRTQRNDSGHPTASPARRDDVYLSLSVFRHHLRRVYNLIGWFKANPAQQPLNP